MELSSSIKKKIRRYEAVTAEGLTLYPITVAEYDEWCMARPGIEAMQQAFPARLMSMPILSAMYRMDMEALINGTESDGLFYRCLLGLALALRLGEGEPVDSRLKRFHIQSDKRDPLKLIGLRYLKDGEEFITITPIQFQRVRPIIAAQNGAEVQPDDVNPELLQAERDIAESNSPKLDVSIEDMMVSVAVFSGADESEMDDWPILKLLRRSEAIKRVLDYMVCGIGECSGSSWKGGNPAPHPFFARVRETSASLIPMAQFRQQALSSATERTQ